MEIARPHLREVAVLLRVVPAIARELEHLPALPPIRQLVLRAIRPHVIEDRLVDHQEAGRHPVGPDVLAQREIAERPVAAAPEHQRPRRLALRVVETRDDRRRHLLHVEVHPHEGIEWREHVVLPEQHPLVPIEHRALDDRVLGVRGVVALAEDRGGHVARCDLAALPVDRDDLTAPMDVPLDADEAERRHPDDHPPRVLAEVTDHPVLAELELLTALRLRERIPPLLRGRPHDRELRLEIGVLLHRVLLACLALTFFACSTWMSMGEPSGSFRGSRITSMLWLGLECIRATFQGFGR